MIRSACDYRKGLSMLELLLAISIMGILAAVAVPRLGGGAMAAKRVSCELNRQIIELQCSRWRREKGRWPSESLAEIECCKRYFPDGLPVCPVEPLGYRIDPRTGDVLGHGH